MAASDSSTWTLPRLRITRDGAWLSEGVEVSHPRIVAVLWETLQVDAGGHYLEVGSVRVPVDVEDAPFIVLRVEDEGDRLMLTLNDLSREPLAPAALRFRPGGVPYCRVKGGRFDARLSRAAAYQLLQHAEPDVDDRAATLVIGRARHPLSGLGDEPPAGDPAATA